MFSSGRLFVSSIGLSCLWPANIDHMLVLGCISCIARVETRIAKAWEVSIASVCWDAQVLPTCPPCESTLSQAFPGTLHVLRHMAHVLALKLYQRHLLLSDVTGGVSR